MSDIDFQPSSGSNIDFQPMDSGISMPESASRGALNNFPMAQQAAAALTPGDYSANLANLNQKAASSKAANPISYGAGAVAGSLAPLVIPGVGEALEAAPVLGNAALGAANAIGNTDLTKNPDIAARQALRGGVIGGAVGKAGSMASDALAPVSNKLESIANKKAVQTLNLRQGTLGVSQEELEDLGSIAHELDLVKGSTPERVAKVTDLKNQVGAQIGDFGAGSQPLLDAKPFTDNLHDALEASSSIYGKAANPEATIYRQGIANLQKPGLTFDELQNLKTAYGKAAFDANHQVRNQAAADVYSQIKDAMKSVIANSPDKDYQEAMENYSLLSDIQSGLTKQLQAEQAGGVNVKGYGMAGKLGGMITGGNPAASIALGVGLAAAGHPFIGLGATTPILNNPQAMSSGARALAKGIPKAAQYSTQELNDYLTSKYGQQPR